MGVVGVVVVVEGVVVIDGLDYLWVVVGGVWGVVWSGCLGCGGWLMVGRN